MNKKTGKESFQQKWITR